jgi:cell division protein FtsA
VEAAGVEVEAYVLNPLASAEVTLTDTEKEMGVVVCDIGGGTTDIAIYIDGNVWHTSVLAVGGNHLTSDIAHGLRLPADIAEKVKIEHGSASASDVPMTEAFTIQPFGEDSPLQVTRFDLATIIEARIEEVFSLILQEIKRTGYDGLLPAGVVLTGGSSQLPGIRKVASGVLSLPCRVAGPHAERLHGLVDKLHGPAYSTSVGLLHWAQRESIAPPTRKKKKPSRTIDLNKGLDFFKRLLP